MRPSPPLPDLLGSPGLRVLLLLGLTVAAYAGVVNAGFVWDDQALVVRNVYTGDHRALGQALRADLWAGAGAGDIGEGSGYWRPLLVASLFLDRAVAGLNPGFAHLHGLAWHLLAVLGVSRLFGRHLGPVAATCATALFALHPVQSEAVVWISARNDPMAAALMIWSLLLLGEAEGTWRRHLAGALLGLGAMLAKESALLLPGVLVLLDLARPGGPRIVEVLRGRRLGLAVLAVLAYVGLRVASGVGSAAWPPAVGFQLLFHRAWDVLSTYARLLVLPWPLSGGRDLESLVLPWTCRLQGSLVLAGLVLGLPLIARRRGPEALRSCLAGLAFACLGFLPSVLALADKGLLGERYLYLPMVGLGLAFGACLPELRTSLLGLGALLAPWIVILSFRLPDWRSDLDLWAAAWRDTPSTWTEASYAHALRGEERNLDAFVHFRAAILGDPPVLDVCPRALASAIAAGRPDLAVSAAPELAGRGCAGSAWGGNLAVALAMSGRWDEARQTALEARDDPARRADLVLAAAALVEENLDGYCTHVANWTGQEPAEAQAARILAIAGRSREADWLREQAATGACP